MKHCTWYMVHCTLILALGLSFASCSDDDDKNGGDDAEKEQTVMPADANDDATVLGSLLQSWVEDFTADDVTPTILGKTFVPTVGEVVDESNATVRTLVVGTQAAADEYAKGTLSMLGISSQQPAGFSCKNAAIGSISYSHGSGNELGVITVSVKQLPSLTKLRLVKDYEGNAQKTAYYQKGDIVKYTGSGVNKDHYFICLNDHTGGNEAIWLSFDIGTQTNDQPVGTCGWMGVGDDYVYKKEQANSDNLRIWLQEFLLNDQGYRTVMERIQSLPLSARNQILPSSEALRKKLIDSLIYTQKNLLLELNRDGNDLKSQYPTAAMSNGVNYEVLKQSGSTEHRCYFPWRLLLTGSMRWSMGFTYDYWVPYVILVKMSESPYVEQKLGSVQSQYYDTGHFTWDKLASDVQYNGESYNIYRVALHWTHDAFQLTTGANTKKYKMLVDFTTHKYDELNKVIDPTKASDLDWTLHNITSHELKVKDNGEPYKYFETVFRGKDGVSPISNDFVGIPHYLPGDVYKDEEGCRWFCIYSAGYAEHGMTEIKSPYAYMMTFDGLTFDESGRRCTNLPSRDLAMKAVLTLNQIYAGISSVTNMDISDFDPYEVNRKAMAYNIWEGAKVNLFHLFNVLSYTDLGDARSNIRFASVAYNGSNDGQSLLRFIFDMVDDNDLRGYFWEHYPSAPVTSYSVGGPKAFNAQEPILLQHIADQQQVTAHASDFYITKPFFHSDKTLTVRTQPDPAAKSAKNYVYDLSRWTQGLQPTSMWWEPVLMFRVTKVYDQGPDNHSSMTIDGHSLTVVSQVSREDSGGFNHADALVECVMSELSYSYSHTYLDGKLFAIPDWKQDWQY